MGKGWPLCSLVCYVILCFDNVPCGVLGQIISIPDLILIKAFSKINAVYANIPVRTSVHVDSIRVVT